MKFNWENMDTTNCNFNQLTVKCNLERLIKNIRSYEYKLNYSIYKVTDEYLIISKKNLTINEIKIKRCELKGEDHHYYW